MSSSERRRYLGETDPDGIPAQHSAVAVTIPGAAIPIRTPWQQSPSLDGSPDTFTAELGASLFSVSLSGAMGASPGGYGLGHLMRRRNSNQSSHSLPRHPSYREVPGTVIAAHVPTDSFMAATTSPLQHAQPGSEEYQYKSALSNFEDLRLPLLQRQHVHQGDAQNARAGDAATIGRGAGTPAAANRTRALVFGILNAIAGLPALIAYCAIVFKHPSYADYVDPLCKLFFLSSAIHQAVFCFLSTLPFAVGQVQDVGIIFLSSMASSIAVLASDDNRDSATAVGTSLLAMTMSTFIVGAATLLVAKKSWSYFVSFVPLPVMGGYLSFVGYFCIASGVGLGTSLDIGSPLSWGGIFHRLPLLKLIPTVASCAAIMLTLEKAHHPLALPSVLLALVGVFHVALFAAGIPLAQAREAGWVMPPAAEGVQFWELFKLYNLQRGVSGIAWDALWRQVGKTAGLTALVIFGSAMDIMAIQADVQGKIDIDRELTTVAVSNMATGALFVGFPGSYIFSQTLVTMRAGVFDRLNGWTIVAAELLAFLLPYSLVTVVPNYFLGGLLLWFGVEIARDWLFLSFTKLTRVEYGLLLVTFFSVIQFGLEGGIAAGVLAATVYFAYCYSESQIKNFSLGIGRLRSSVVRPVEQQAALSLLWHTRTAAAKVHGFIFFGTAHSISSKLQNAATVLATATATEDDGSVKASGEGVLPEKMPFAVAAIAAAPNFLIIDWSKATGCDASGARSVAGALKEITALGVTPVITAAHHHGIEEMLEAHDVRLRRMHWPPDLRVHASSPLDAYADAPLIVGGDDEELERRRSNDWQPRMSCDSAVGYVVRGGPADIEDGNPIDPDTVLTFATVEEGLRFCEDVLLRIAVRFGLCNPPSDGIPLEQLLASHLEALPLAPIISPTAAASELRRYLHHQVLRKGEHLWRVNDPADELYIVERGVVRVDELRSIEEDDGQAGRGLERGLERRAPRVVGAGDRRLVRSYELGPGCVGGSTDFFLARPHGTRAVCASDAARVLRLDRTGMQQAASDAPAALSLLQLAVMRANSVDLLGAVEASMET